MVKNVMVVDDEPGVVISVRAGLDSLDAGYNVISADSGKACFKLLQQGPIPDLILLDIMMPGMSGWETFDKLREQPSWKNIPIVFLTARADRVAKNAGQFLGSDYIEKPFDIGDLKERIDVVLDRRT